MTRLWTLLVFTAGIFLGCVSLKTAQCQTVDFPAPCVLPGDEVWLISARDDVSAGTCPSDSLQCQQYRDGFWQDSSWLAISPSSPGDARETMVFIHGYNTNLHYAKKRGLQVYQNLLATSADRPPVRYVIWAWRSERELVRPVRDYVLKSQRAVSLGSKFAWTLNVLGTKPAIILGYSLGVQVAVSALTHSPVYSGPPVQLAVIAAANDCRFAAGCDLQFRNSGRISRTLIIYNRRDRVIRTAGAVCKARYRQRFQFFEQIAQTRPCYFGQVDIVDISDVATKRHAIVSYTKLSPVQSSIQGMLSCGPSSNLTLVDPSENRIDSPFLPGLLPDTTVPVVSPIPVP